MVDRVKMPNNGPPRHHEPTLLELEQALHIDTLDLIDADATQPELFYRVAKLLAGLKAEHDTCRLQLEEARSHAQGVIRMTMANASSSNKPTVGQVDAMIQLDPAVRALNEQVTEINRRIGAVSALKEAYSQRKSSLSDLVELQRQAGTPIDPAVVRSSMSEQRRRR